FNDMNMAGWKAYDLTTIRQPLKDIILGSVELVVSLIENPDRPPEARLLPCHVMERSTLRKIPD
ncbi:MAG: substrate-binding domain-containing protein, partial [Rhodospirillales bacterium]|nr:substrate-binding domain-containing protein [Rhodospirillales bacterium]